MIHPRPRILQSNGPIDRAGHDGNSSRDWARSVPQDVQEVHSGGGAEVIVKIEGDLIAGLPMYESGIQLLCLQLV